MVEKGADRPLPKPQNGLRINVPSAMSDAADFESLEFLKSVSFHRVFFFFANTEKICVFICAKQQAEHSKAILQQQRRRTERHCDDIFA